MNKIVERLTLNASAGGTQAVLYAKRGDTGTRELIACISGQGNAFKPSDAASAVINAKKPDGTCVCADCTVENGKIRCVFPSQLISAAGVTECELEVYDGNMNRLTSPRFDIIVEDVLYDENAVVSTDDYSALVSALARAEGVTDGITPTFTLTEEGDLYVDYLLDSNNSYMKATMYDPTGKKQDIFAYADAHKNDTAVHLTPALKQKWDGHALNTENPHGVTAAQAGAVPVTCKVNGKALSADITLSAADVGAAAGALTFVGTMGIETDADTKTISFDLTDHKGLFLELKPANASAPCVTMCIPKVLLSSAAKVYALSANEYSVADGGHGMFFEATLSSMTCKGHFAYGSTSAGIDVYYYD